MLEHRARPPPRPPGGSLTAPAEAPGPLLPGRYAFEGSNIDTEHNHLYRITGACTLTRDGRITEGTAQEESLVWKAPIEYVLDKGRWTLRGDVHFLLAHADERSTMFDPFYFELRLEEAVAPRLSGSPPPGASRATVDGTDAGEVARVWKATSGWWKTSDDDGATPGGASDAGSAAWSHGAPRGSFGRILSMRFRRLESL